MQITYCELWSSKRRKPTGAMSADQARQLDAGGKSYSVVLGDPEAPRSVIEVVPENNYFNVNFIDGEGRISAAYGFSKIDDSRLFLTKLTLWTYPEGARSKSQASRIESFEFRPDGYAAQTVNDKSSDQIETTEKIKVPVDTNWEPVPEFGSWESIARYDRETPAN